MGGGVECGVEGWWVELVEQGRGEWRGAVSKTINMRFKQHYYLRGSGTLADLHLLKKLDRALIAF